MTDTITITDLVIWTHIGITEAERAKEQRLLITLELQKDLSIAGKSDDLSQSIDYEQVCHQIRNLSKKERLTIESFAEDIATSVLQSFKPEQVSVTIKKYIIPDTDHVSVTITRP